MRVTAVPHLCQHLVFWAFTFSHSGGYSVVTCCGSEQYHPEEQGCWACFYVLINHLEMFHNKISVQSYVRFLKLGYLAFSYCS